ncbi:hypothetical protein P9202_27 [Prochlorococcus marinus str. MIT 9202]|nr:hypothetical protein P9202_27 [Prochlorococcus marinus str. MIT 9202]
MIFISDFVLLNLDKIIKIKIKKEPNLILNSTLNLSKVNIR